MTLTDAGFVGIGTTAPNNKFEVVHSHATEIPVRFRQTNTSFTGQVLHLINDSTHTYAGALNCGSGGTGRSIVNINYTTDDTNRSTNELYGVLGIGHKSSSQTNAIAISVNHSDGSVNGWRTDFAGNQNSRSLTLSNDISLSRENSTTGNVRIYFRPNSGEATGFYIFGLKANVANFEVDNWTAGPDIVPCLRIVGSTGVLQTVNGTVSGLSDSRLKKDVTNIDDGLELLNQFRPVSFKYNGMEPSAPNDNILRTGFIADEVQAIAPRYVQEQSALLGATYTKDPEKSGEQIITGGENADDVKSISNGSFVPMMVKAIQELSAKVTALEDA
jgi:hypothetical protein